MVCAVNKTGANNTAVGKFALLVNTDSANTAVGADALQSNTEGNGNTAVGFEALYDNTMGPENTAVGALALTNNIGGIGNTAVGHRALFNATGEENIALGASAGFQQTTGSDTIYIGHIGVGPESNTTRIGDGDQTRTFISGIRGVTAGEGGAIAVLISGSGQLGTVSSSLRYKEDIRDMSEASDRLMQLRPVTFRYKKAYAAGAKPIHNGLIAEEVAEVYPGLVVYNDDGQPETVQYRKVNAMLLNEVQKQHRQIADLTARLAELERR